ncbi:MAG: adenylyltransferase/cytidyltransferase family protein [Prolixibacteraceae bacterium]|jgi:cytidyltransferase-like protein|nr:adenylyltransferase/cytidyltransferase family protein [Prolixibacteraceae bacterium]
MNKQQNNRVFVSGCYDLLHSGHVAFFKEASQYGDLYVGIGSDATIAELKGRQTINSEQERLYMVKSVRYVEDAFINSGNGIIDFENEIKQLAPAYFIVNEDGYSPAKEEICNQLGIKLKVLERIPDAGLPPRSTTSIRASDNCTLPYRIDLAGTWIDQPYVSKYHPGWAVTLSLEPIVEYNERCGMSTSTRNAAKKIWPYYLPIEKPEKLAEMLFKFENDPGAKIISGAQDAIGICMPGLVRHYYDNAYWPKKFESCHDESVLKWLENHIYMVMLWPRPKDLDLLTNTSINTENVKDLSDASEKAWDAIMEKDIHAFARAFLSSFKAQTTMFPNMLDDEIRKVIERYKNEALAWKLAGAGGGGYLILISEKPVKDAMRIKIRRKEVGI